MGRARRRGRRAAIGCIAADLDNNGALDLIAAGRRRVAHLAGGWQITSLQALPTPPDGEVFSVVDLNGDGMLDLVGVSRGGRATSMARQRHGAAITGR